MNNIQKMLIPFVILALVTSAIAAYETGSDETNITTENIENISINGNISNPTSDLPVAEIEEAKLPTAADEKSRFENRKKFVPKYVESQKNKSVEKSAISIANEQITIPSTIPTDVSYTNPMTGISVFGKLFATNYIYVHNYTEWNRYTFYLPVASYIYIDVSGRLLNFLGLNHYDIYMDSDFLNSGDDVGICNVDSACFLTIKTSRLTYLAKGWHTLYLSGWVYDIPPDDGYYTYGFLSITAFPEYTAITVTSPNGGETWYRGQTKMITWKKDGNPGANVIIELYKAGIRSSVISSKTSNDGSYSWYIPTYQPIGADYKIKITSYEEPTKYSDWSNNNFRIY